MGARVMIDFGVSGISDIFHHKTELFLGVSLLRIKKKIDFPLGP